MPPSRRAPLALALAIVAISTGAPFARWAAPAPPIAIAALRVALASILLLAAGWRELPGLGRLAPRDRSEGRSEGDDRTERSPGRHAGGAVGPEQRSEGRSEGDDRPLVVLSGALLAIHFGSWIASLSFTSTAASVALVCTNPIFAALFGRLLGDRVARRELVGMAVAAVGCAVLAGGDWRAGGDALVGDGLALVGAASAAAYLVVGRRLRSSVPLLPYLGAVNAIAAVMLGVAAVALGAPLASLPAHSYAACAGAAAIASFIGHSLLNAAVRVTPAHVVSLVMLGEPIGSSIITWLAFGEQPPLHAALGGAIVLAGIGFGFIRRPATDPALAAA